jgi:mono/diheme cytochrome c family protein
MVAYRTTARALGELRMRQVESLLLVASLAASAAGCHGDKDKKDGPQPSTFASASTGASTAAATAGAPLVRAGAARDGSTVALARAGATGVAIVSDATERALRVVELPAKLEEGATAREVSSLHLDARPGQVVVGPDGRVFVALRDAGAVGVFRHTAAGGLEEITRVATDADPTALAVTPDDAKLLVVHGAGASLVALSLPSLAPALRAEIARSPRAVTVAADGAHAFVSHTTGSLVSRVDLASGKTEAVAGTFPRGDLQGRGTFPLLHGFGVVDHAGAAIVPGVLVATGDTSVRTKDGYGHLGTEHLPAEAFRIARFGDAAQPLVEEARLTRAGVLPESCLLPRAAALDPGEEWLYVACAGPGRLYKIDVSSSKTPRAEHAWSVPERAPDRPSGLALDLERRIAVVWSDAAGTIALYPMDAHTEPQDGQPAPGGPVHDTKRFTFATRPSTSVPAVAQQGRALFWGTNNPGLSSDGRTCASCHIDGGEDGLTWPTPEGPRQTPALAGRLANTAPYSWSGKRPSIRLHIEETIHRLGGEGLLEPDRESLVSYLATLEAPPPRAPNADAVARGKDIFMSTQAQCSRCHLPPSFTDGVSHDVSSRTKGDAFAEFDTPSLVSIAGTAPYFHDGRYATLHDLLVGCDGAMGHTKQLGDADLAALQAYLGSL